MVIQFLKRLRISPVLCTAIGAAAGFYILFHAAFPVIAAVLLFFLTVFSFLMVLFSLNTQLRINAQPRMLKLYTICSAALTVGLVLGISAAGSGQKEFKFGLPENQITAIEGVLLEDPRIISGGNAMVSVSLRKCASGSTLRVSGSGEITVFFPREYVERLKYFGRGTVIFVEGSLRSNERSSNEQSSNEQSSSKRKNSGQSWSISAKSLHIVKTAPPIERMRTGVRLNLSSRFSGKNWGGLALALLLGIKDNLDTDMAVMYRNAGLSYILALSGMHLAILAALITFLLKKPLGLKASAICGAVIILLYCFLVGSMPSLNRAAMMYLLGVLAILGALPKKPISILSLSFLIQIIITPAAGSTISFILSYLALVGILLIGKPLISLFSGKVPDFLLQPLAVSCGAFLATAGVCSVTFGILAPVGIVIGLVMVPLTTVFMIGSIIWLVLDFFSLSALINLPLSVLYRLMEIIVSAAGKVPGISAGVFAIILSFVLSLLIIVFEYKRRLVLLRPEPFL
jgi:competence protein ComEC